MKRSTDRILTTHVGSLARPHDLLDTMKERENGRPYDAELLDRQIRDAVADRVRQQVECGIDIVTDGEMSKVSFLGYVKDRLGGFEADMGEGVAAWRRRGRRRSTTSPTTTPSTSRSTRPRSRRCAASSARGPISYVGQELLQTDIDNLKAATAPLRRGRRVHAVDRAERVRAQRVLPHPRGVPGRGGRGDARGVPRPSWTPASSCRSTTRSSSTCSATRRWRTPSAERLAWMHVEALNHALRGIPPESIRHHTCYGLNHGPRMNDIPLATAVPFMLAINAGAYSFEVANPRHYHEWRIWEDIKLPEGKILIPGLIGHATNYVEHPELIADYIVKYAGHRRAART